MQMIRSIATIAAGVTLTGAIVGAAASSWRASSPLDGRPHALTLDDVAFMAGQWEATVPGGELEEFFSAPRNGTMVGMFRWMAGGATTLTEHITIEQTDDGVIMFLRHFNPGSVVWESEADGPMRYQLTEAADGRAVFTNDRIAFPRHIVYHRAAPGAMSAILDGTTENGQQRRMQFDYRSTSMTTTSAPELLNDAGKKLGFHGELTIALQVADMAKARQWYQDTLGFNQIYEVAEIGWCELTCPISGVQIGLSQVESPKVGGPTPTFSVKDIDAARKALESKKVRFDGPTQEIPGLVKLATFFDPDGNSFMLSQTLAEGMP